MQKGKKIEMRLPAGDALSRDTSYGITTDCTISLHYLMQQVQI
jgi:hypothetical protein